MARISQVIYYQHLYMYNVKLAQLTGDGSVFVRSWVHSRPGLCITTLLYMPVRILSSKTNNFGKDSHPKLPSGWFLTFSHTQRGSISRPSSWETNVRSAVLCDTLLMFSVKTIYMMFYGVSTPVITFWLICTTRRWDRGSVWGRILFLSELILF